MNGERSGASFRDPAGFMYTVDGVLYRQVNPSYLPHYELLMSSGLYDTLVSKGWLVRHAEVPSTRAPAGDAGRTLRPDRIPYISYPYEWCFSQLRDAAVTTLRIQRRALESGMCLKDASAFNIQFLRGRPVLIDTLSLETLVDGRPWVAYRQFCRHFLAPLALMSYRDVRLAQLFRGDLDGIPLDLASALLPRRTCLRPSLLFHLHLHARGEEKLSRPSPGAARAVSRRELLALTEHLESAVSGLAWTPRTTVWGRYDGTISYSEPALAHKSEIVSAFLTEAGDGAVWDLGGGTGRFARLAGAGGHPTVSWDRDPAAVEASYRACVRDGETRVLPLVLDLLNPTPALGWANAERRSLAERGPVPIVLALALLHHLVLAGGVPLDEIAEFLARIGRWLVAEFVPLDDPQVRVMIAGRAAPPPHAYTLETFEAAFRAHFSVVRAEPIRGSGRILFLMTAKTGA